MEQPGPSLTSASATGVLGEYRHAFRIESDDEFVILYGPNGVGKTKFLELIDAIVRLDGNALIGLPFETIELEYSDGSLLSARKTEQPPPSDQMPDSEAPPNDGFGVFVELKQLNLDVVTWNYLDDGFEAWVRDRLPYRKIDDDLWEDPADGEILHVDELRARFSRRVRKRTPEPPQELKEFAGRAPCRLIETQRLRIEHFPDAHINGLRRYGSSRVPRRPSSRIARQAEMIQNLLNAAQTDHSRITQRLDRKFPSRVLSETGGDDIDPDAIRTVYNEQNEFRSRLARVASVALDDELELPKRVLQDWELRLLKRYLDDASEKLEPFVDLLEKVELLEQIMNSRLLNKRLEVTDKAGVSVTHSETMRPIPLDSLSSGEQHEIILMIDLLFNVPAGAIVLVDEPEISLHVVWQLAFIPDVRRIAELANFRFVVATHSPQIINDEWDKAIRLGPPEAAF